MVTFSVGLRRPSAPPSPQRSDDHLVADEHVRSRFLREMELTAKLNHPGIVTIFEASSSPEQLFLVMEYIAGQQLDSAIRSDGLAPRQAVAIVLDLLDAVSYLHGRGLARIDLKPSNIILRDGKPITIDLGIARSVGSETTNLASGLAGPAGGDRNRHRAESRASIPRPGLDARRPRRDSGGPASLTGP